ncbi:MAG: pirin family protein [Marinifilaceae bacterium]
MEKIIHRAESRGQTNLDWLVSRHSFSFAGYYCPERIKFGTLRVLNDDRVMPGMGFGTHPHENMEIISIPLKGSLEHKDSMGNTSVIRTGEVQVMSAGSGILHSEYNASREEEVHFLQIWILPNQMDVAPRYQQMDFLQEEKNGVFHCLVGPWGNGEVLEIHQDVYISRGDFQGGTSVEYTLNKAGNGVYFFLIKGRIEIDGTILDEKDGIGIRLEDRIPVSVLDESQILVLEVGD